MVEANDDCTGGKCTCTTDKGSWSIEQGRVALNIETSELGISPGFGVHLVNLSARVTTGGVGLPEVEAAFSERLGDMTAIDDLMDFNVGLFTTDLNKYTTPFAADDVPYLVFTWTDDTTSETWYSAIVHVPGTMMVLELFSQNYTASAYASEAHKAANPRIGDAAGASGESRDQRA